MQKIFILAISFSVLHKYFNSLTKLFFWSVSSSNFRSFSKIILFVFICVYSCL